MLSIYIAPNVNTYTESIKYYTRVFESLNGYINSAVGLIDFKYIVKYTSLIFYTQHHMAFINLFREGLGTTVEHPLWGQGAKITQTSVGTTTIPCEHFNSDFEIGEVVFVASGKFSYEVVTLVDIQGNNLIVNTPVDIVSGTFVFPSFIGYITGDINTTYTGENYAVCEIKVEEI